MKAAGSNRLHYFLLLLAVAVTYAISLRNGYTGWDDDLYIRQTTAIHALNGTNISLFFSQPLHGSYVPFTWLSLAFDYALAGENPLVYILHNILLHALACVLVYRLVLLLLGNARTALFTALLFAVHPMHVESVAWMAERKDVLLACWFLASLLAYEHFRTSKKRNWFWASLLFFVFACFSKQNAVALLPLLILFDYFRGRSLAELSGWLQKIPFLVITVVFVVIGLRSASAGTAALSSYDLPIAERLAITGYAADWYLLKAALPVQPCAYYPYPFAVGEEMPSGYWPSLLLFPVLAVLVFRYRKKYPVLFFGFFFFTINLIPALQLFPVGDALIADRFLYLPLLGVMLFFADAAIRAYDRGKSFVQLMLTGVVIVFAAISINYCMVWENGKTLWTDVTSKGGYASLPLVNLGMIHASDGETAEAMKCFEDAAKLNPKNFMAFYNLGVAKMNASDFKTASAAFGHAAHLQPADADTWLGLGSVRRSNGEYAASVRALDSCLLIRPRDSRALWQRGFSRYMNKDFKGAEADYTSSLQIDSLDNSVYAKRGILRYENGDTLGGCSDFSKAASLGNAEAKSILEKFCR